MSRVAFDALDYVGERRFAAAHYEIEGSTAHGFVVRRDGREALRAGPGHRLLRVRSCGVCATDLARAHLPFPLPQVIGHEVLAVDEAGRRFVVEINASHAARGVPHDCAFCRSGLATHCPERRTLGIHDLPGGFGSWVLAPVHACLPVPDELPDDTAVLAEPFAAALHAVRCLAPRDGDRIAVLGPRRLGMLVIAALAAVRAAEGLRCTVVALARDERLLRLARQLGADEGFDVGHGEPPATFDVVVDTTGSPAGLETAVRLARREVHLKSTHGRRAAGLDHLTEFVVDELRLESMSLPALQVLPVGARVAWLAAAPAPEVDGLDVRVGTAAELARAWASAAGDGLPGAAVAVVDDEPGFARAVRPFGGEQGFLVRPRGRILLAPSAEAPASPLLRAVRDRGLALGSSRCGDFADALRVLSSTPALHGLGAQMVTHRFGAFDLGAAFAAASSRACIKAVVEHR
jgi:threonine dehydrogenase-like Zn-dependent dehydrogenase